MRILTMTLAAILLLSSLAMAQDDGMEEGMPAWNPEPGQIVHTEIPSLNLEESAAFYEGLFGWTMTPAPGAEDTYLIWNDGGATTGGFSTGASPMDGGVVLYIFAVNIADAYVAIEAAGGTASGLEISVGEGEGYIGMFNDPHGNLIGLFSMEQSMPDAEVVEESAQAVDPHAGHNH